MDFILGKKTSTAAVFRALAQRFAVRQGKRRHLTRTLFDTFDRRLFLAGQSLEEVREGDRVEAEWRDTTSGKRLGVMKGQVAALARDWHPASLARALEHIIKVRALLPMLTLHTVRSAAELLDEQGTTVVHVMVDVNTIIGCGNEAVKPPMRCVRVIMVRNYRSAFQLATLLLENLRGVTRTTLGVPDDVLSVYSRVPLLYSSKIEVSMAPGISSTEAVQKVFARLVEIMEANQSGVVTGIDTEFLHDFRVAVRRSRSLLSQMKQSIPTEIFMKFKPEFDWLGKVTGPLRDLDVFLLKFDEYALCLDENIRSDLIPLKNYLHLVHRREQKKIAHALSSERYLRFIASWKATLNSCWTSASAEWKGGDPAEVVAGQRILKIFRRAVKQGAALKKRGAAAAVHELRITCKKLRYLIEFFRPLFLPERIEPFLKSLREVQEKFGDFQDYQVHRESLRTFAEEMVTQNEASGATVLTLWKLSETLAARQNALRKEIEQNVKSFFSKKNRAQFRSLFSCTIKK